MRLLFTRFPLESALGGAEVQTLSLMEGLRNKGHEVIFLGSCPVLLEETGKLKMKNEKLKMGSPPVTKWGAVSFLWRKGGMRKKLESALEKIGNIDAILMLSLSEKILLTPIALKRGIKVIWIEHDRIGPWLTKNPWLPKLKKMSGQITTVSVSELSQKLYINLGFDPDHTIAIPDGVDPDRFGPAPGPRLQQKLLRIGCIARLTKDKGVDILIETIKDYPGASLRILGKGGEENALRALITKLNLNDRVAIENEVPDLGAFYHSLDLLILPSREHDPFGMVAAEAMMLGIPVIVTDACGIADYLTSGTDALVVEAGSTRALSEAIFTMSDHETRTRVAQAGKQTAEREFTLEKMVDRYEQLLTL